MSSEARKPKCEYCNRPFIPLKGGATETMGPGCAKKANAGIPSKHWAPRTNSNVIDVNFTNKNVVNTSLEDAEQLDLFAYSESQTNLDEVSENAVVSEVVNKTNEEAIETTTNVEAPTNDEDDEQGYYDVNGEYKWAKKSAIQNIGEDVEGAARHKRNQHRSWEDFDGEVDKIVQNKDLTGEHLNKMVIQDLISKTDDDNVLKNLTIQSILAKFPKSLVKAKDEENAEFNAVMKANAQKVLAMSELHDNPFTLIDKYRDSLHEQIRHRRLKKENPRVTNALITVHNSLLRGRATAVPTRVADFMSRVYDGVDQRKLLDDLKNSADPKEILNSINKKGKENAIALMKGKSMNAAFGTIEKGKKKSNENDFEESFFYDGVKFKQNNNNYKTYEDSKKYLVDKAALRSIQYGNSLNDKEKEYNTKATAQSFDDLTKITGLSEKDISCGGTLAIAFGARGRKGSMAHYEPSKNILNINRNSIGALAHELGHALDYSIKSKSSVSGDSPASQKTRMNSGAAPTSVDLAFSKLNSELDKYRERMATTESYRNLSWNKKKYYNAPTEVFARCFESYVEHKGKKQGIENTYLVAHVDHELYPTNDEREVLQPLFDSLMKAIKG